MNNVPNQRYLKFKCRREEKVPSRKRRGKASMPLSSCRVVESSAVIDPLRGIHFSTTFGYGQNPTDTIRCRIRTGLSQPSPDHSSGVTKNQAVPGASSGSERFELV